MNKFKIVSLAAGTMLALAFTSCSSDESDDGGGSSSSGTPQSTVSSSSGGGGGSSSSVGDDDESSSSVNEGYTGSYGSLPDSRDSKTYKTVVIGTQTWMAENLNYDAPDSECYDGEADNCTTYGRLYNWETAKTTACPTGWHLPSNDDWDKLLRYVDEQNGGEGSGTPYDSYTAGKYLKATSGWNSDDGVSGNGTDKYGFSSLGGGGYSGGDFDDAGYYGYWWSSSEGSSDYAYFRGMRYYNGHTDWGPSDKSDLFSVRCLQD